MNQFRLSAGVIVVRRVAGIPHYLLVRAFNYWDFPKGMVHADEEPLAAAVREVEEETALRDLVFRWGKDFRETEPYRNGIKVARYYLAESERGEVTLLINPELGHPEHDASAWLPLDKARALLADRVKPILEWAQGIVKFVGLATTRSTDVIRLVTC
ncbi:MAG: NUDIX domain-containing protein [Desulfobacterales bacterium]|nr:NUDIX domain-containing protein [Desulfobacterales bacterium]